VSASWDACTQSGALGGHRGEFGHGSVRPAQAWDITGGDAFMPLPRGAREGVYRVNLEPSTVRVDWVMEIETETGHLIPQPLRLSKGAIVWLEEH